MIDKTVATVEEAVSGIRDGATIMIGGFGRAGQPVELIDALIAQGASGLTIINNNAGNGDVGLAALLAKKRVRKILCSFPRQHDSWVFDGLYREAGLDLKADLATLTQTADIAADPGSVETLRASSGLTGDLQMPVVTLHTLDDVLAPVQVEQEYAEDVRGAHDASLLRQFFVDHVGHCNFTAAEIAAGIEVLQQRVESGHWSGSSATVMNRLAASLDDSGSAFVATQPGEFLGDREGRR